LTSTEIPSGAITAEAPASLRLNHTILAIKVPDGLNGPSLVAILQHPKLGRILFFNPTDDCELRYPHPDTFESRLAAKTKHSRKSPASPACYTKIPV
jgi:hypothetical protein